MFDRVTITGADDSINPSELVALSQEFPRVEWGILVSHAQQGTPRFPSWTWISQLHVLARQYPMQLSLHLCGRWVRQLLEGVSAPIPRWMLKHFQRIQLNFHGEDVPWNAEAFVDEVCRLGYAEIIFQLDGHKGEDYLSAYLVDNSNGVPLFDRSGGAGMLPEKWPGALWIDHDAIYLPHGYAGGLGPRNLATELPRIAVAAGEAPWWVDIESGVRSADDRQCDLRKVRRCLEIAQAFRAKEAC